MNIMAHLADPPHVLAGPAHPDPYPFYGRLARERPFFHDPALGCWVAVGAGAVCEVLNSPICHTRPLENRIPHALGDGPAAGLYGRLVRLRDGSQHTALKRAVALAVRSLDLTGVAELARAQAIELEAELGPPIDGPAITRFAFAFPVQVIGLLLGISATRRDQVAGWLSDYGGATAAAATGVLAPDPELLKRGDAAAAALLDLVAGLLRPPSAAGPLLLSLVDSAGGALDPEEITANAVGFLVQAYVAIASATGLTLLALARRPSLRPRVVTERGALGKLIDEALRLDPTTNSTIRFVAEDGLVAGHQLRAGEKIVVMIGAANRDPALNPEPDSFDLDRAARRSLEFGAGAHSCPADKLAPLIVEIALDHLLKRGGRIDDLEAAVAYAPSAHIRSPRFAAGV